MNEIHTAARLGDLETLRRLIAEGVPVDEYDEDSGHTPLMLACMSPKAGPEVLEFLIDSGADVNAPVKAKPREMPNFDFGDMLEDADLNLDPEIRAMLENSRQMVEQFNYAPDVPPLPVAVLGETSLEKLKLLFARGADLQARSSSGYTLIIRAIYDQRPEVLDYLIEAGAPLDGVTSYGESALSVFSHRGLFADVRKLLAHGADPQPLQWTPLMHAVAAGDLGEVKSLVEAGADLEAADGWGRTAFLLSLHAGQREVAEYLLASGAKRDARGRYERPAASYPAERNDAVTLQWLLAQGIDPEDTDQFDNTALKQAVESGASDCVRVLLEAGADWQRPTYAREPLIKSASDPETIRLLVARGAKLADLETEALRSYIGLGTANALPVSREEYLAGRFRRFGTANPERMEIPFWRAMVGCGWNAYRAAEQFGDSSFGRGNPVWCYDRFGMSLTALPDGRFVQIAGEHEDSYDPDFCIYNEVFIHDGKGGFEILGYPEEVFPPTDFHSATLLDEWIYIIGNLGYREPRGGKTPVYRLHTGNWSIEKVATTGDDPGWISRHAAQLEDGLIRISGGKRLEVAEDESQTTTENAAEYWFDPASGVWERISAED